jgi:hypothetical protein
MLVLYPVARLIARYGQRSVFIGGALIRALGLALAAVGIWLGSFALFVLTGWRAGRRL